MRKIARFFRLERPEQPVAEEKTARPVMGGKNGPNAGEMPNQNESVILESDRVILVVGRLGCGKTQFIKNLSGCGKPDAALSGGTTSINAYVKEEANSSSRLILVDTPPIDTGSGQEQKLHTNTALDIKKWLDQYKVQSISGVVYLYNILTDRLPEVAYPHILIRDLLPFCSTIASKNGADKQSIMSLLTMTHADLLPRSDSRVKHQKNAEILRQNWKNSLPNFRIASGSSDYLNTDDSAWKVLNALIEAKPSGPRSK